MRNTLSNVATAVFLLALFASLPVQAVVKADARALLERGVSAFQAGKPEQARDYLLAARKAGLRSNALTYNLGVVNYQLARYEDASREFHSLLESPHRDLARYNLGLIELAREDIAEAQKIFAQLSERAGNDQVRRLAAGQLARLPEAVSATSVSTGPSGLILIGAGYDSNVDQLPEAAASGAGEAYTDALVTLGADVAQSSSGPGVWSLDGVGYHQYFPGDKGSNLSLLEAGAGWESRRRGVNGEVQAFTQHWWLASDRVESHYGVRTSAWSSGCGLLGRCYGKFSLARVSGGDNYQEYDGWQYDLETGSRKERWGGVLGLELGLSLGDREDVHEPEYAASVSPFRKRLELSWRRPIAPDLAVTAETAYRHSDYKGDYRWQTAGEWVSRQRQDERWSAGLQVDWQPSKDWFVSGEWRYDANDSSLDGYDYDRYNLWLGAGKRF